jgi:hypothetical protein
LEEVYCSECGNGLCVEADMRGVLIVVPCQTCTRKAYDNGADETLELLTEYEKEIKEIDYGKA